MVPQGKSEKNPKGKYLGFNEFIVYDESQVRMRYLIRCKVNWEIVDKDIDKN